MAKLQKNESSSNGQGGPGTPVDQKAVLANGAPDLSRFTRSSATLGLRGDIAIHAPPAFGKSFLAASASAKWPGEDLGKRAVALDDILWVALDIGACDGLLASQIDVIHHIDARDLIEEFGLTEGIRHTHALTREMVSRNPGIRAVVYDTVSELDKLWQADLEGQGGDGDGRWVFRQLLSKHRIFHAASHRHCGQARPIYLAHSSAIADFNDKTPDSQRNQRKATRMPGGAEIKLDVTGKGHDIYINNASLVLSLAVEERKGTDPVRFIISGGTGFETKNRLQGLVGAKEPFGLGPILTRVDLHIAKVRVALSAEIGGRDT